MLVLQVRFVSGQSSESIFNVPSDGEPPEAHRFSYLLHIPPEPDSLLPFITAASIQGRVALGPDAGP
jgi:hypothetical protein